MARYIEQFHNLKIFRKNDIVALLENENAAKELLRRYKQKGLILKVRRDLYVVADLATKASIASRYEIGSQINSSSYLSHHAALEYHGLGHQLFYEIQVSSKERFSNFEFNGIRYIYSESKFDDGVITPNTDTFIRVTDLERTIIDCINQMDRSGGLEEMLECFALITYVNENKLFEYLGQYNKQVLYQKSGFILSYFQNEMKISDSFINFCKSKTGKSTSYLTDDHQSVKYYNEWKLYAPANILSFLEQGGNINV
jgi:predicted transcriptional regulator of viral defense system